MLKAYIKTHEFDLPMNHDVLMKKVDENIYKDEELFLQTVGRLHPITKIEGNDYLKIDKQKTNIFLLNFLLLVLKKENQNIEHEFFGCDRNIISELNKLTNLNLSADYEEIEHALIKFLNTEEETSLPFSFEEEISDSDTSNSSPISEQQEEKVAEEATTSAETEAETPSEAPQPKEDTILNNVKFSMAWVKKAHSKLQATPPAKKEE